MSVHLQRHWLQLSSDESQETVAVAGAAEHQALAHFNGTIYFEGGFWVPGTGGIVSGLKDTFRKEKKKTVPTRR